MKTLTQLLADTHAQAVADSKGTSVVGPDGTLLPPPTTQQLRDDFLAQRAILIGQNSLPSTAWPMSNNALFRRVATLTNNLTATQQQLSDLQAAVPGMIAEAVTSAINALVGGMLPESLDTLKELVDHMQADETGLATLLAQQSADRTRFALLEGPVAALPDQLAAKANATTVQGISQRVGATESALTTKADSSTVVSLQTTVAGKAEASAIATLQITVAGKADSTLVATLRTDLTGRVDTVTTTANNTQAAVSALQPIVTGHTTDIAALKAVDAGLRTDLTTAQGAITTNTTDIAKRLRKDASDTSAGNISAAKATANGQVLVFEQLGDKQRVATVTVTTQAISVGNAATATVTWPTPFADNNYVIAQPSASNASLLGGQWVLTSQTAAGCVFKLTNSTLVAINMTTGTLQFTATHL